MFLSEGAAKGKTFVSRKFSMSFGNQMPETRHDVTIPVAGARPHSGAIRATRGSKERVMVHSASSRRLVLFSLVLLLTASPTWAVFPAWESAAGKLLAVFQWLSAPAGRSLGAGSPSRPLTEKSGCSIDPWGVQRCDLGAAVRPGCTIDSRGRLRCVPVVTPKSGCSIDPDGSPRCNP